MVKEIDYKSELLNFKNNIDFEGTGMVLYPHKVVTSSGTKIWYVEFNKDIKYKFSMYRNKRTGNLEFRCCNIDDNIVSGNYKTIARVNEKKFLTDPNAAYIVLGDLYEEVA